MTYALRGVFLRFCSAPLFRAVALPVKAILAVAALLMVAQHTFGAIASTSGGNGFIIYVPLNDCPANASNVDVTVGGTITFTDGTIDTIAHGTTTILSSGNAISVDGGTVHGMLVESHFPSLFATVASVNMTVVIGPHASAAKYETYSDYWLHTLSGGCNNQPGTYVSGFQPYYANGSATCQNSQALGCFGNQGNNQLSAGYTNNTATPQEVTWNGNSALLQPGQSTNFTLTWPVGTTGSFGVANQNSSDGSFDSPPFQNIGYGSNLVAAGGGFLTNDYTIGFTNFGLPPGPNGQSLATGQGGVNWSGITNTSPANNGTLDAGFQLLNNDLLQNQNADTFNWSNFLSQLHNTNNPIDVSGQGQPPVGTNQTSGLASNVWVQNWPSNLFNIPSNNFEQATQVWVENWPTNISTNAALGMVWANTNQAGAIVSGASAQVGSLSGMVPNSLDDNAGGAAEQDIRITPATAQQQVTIAMGVLPSSLSTTFSQIRGVIAWFVCILLAIWNFASLFRTIKDVSQVPQAQGPDTGAWAAVGANVLTAIVVASAIVAVISVIPVFAVGILAGELTFANTYSSSSPLNFFNSMGWGFQFLSQYLPIYLMFTAFGVRVVYYFGLEVLAFFACIVIKLLIGV